MTPSKLDDALKVYQLNLDKLDHAPRPDSATVLSTLQARDQVAHALADNKPDSVSSVLAVLELDQRLKKLAGRVAATAKLADWRASLRLPPEAWWWSLDTLAPADRFDWLWSALTVLCLTASFSLMAEISKRFLSGGPDWLGAFATLSQAVVALLAAGGALTTAGREAVERILSKVPRRFRQEWKLIMALGVLALVLVLRFSLPSIARRYNNSGYGYRQAGQLKSAMDNLKRAINLNPDYYLAHYNLGLVYEDLLDTKSAQAEYQIAVLGGLDSAYNNLARLYILQDDPSAAVTLLFNGLGKTQDTSVRYTMLKNLGWARLAQKRYDEAIGVLREAVGLAPQTAATHCLLAQALEGQGDKDATTEWGTCLKYAGSRESPEEDKWIGQARQFFVTPASGGRP